MLGGKKPDIKVGGDYSTVPADKYTVQVVDVNFKTRFNSFKGVEVEGLNFQFAILDNKPSEDADGTTRGHYLCFALGKQNCPRHEYPRDYHTRL